jgi:hypothetical protein
MILKGVYTIEKVYFQKINFYYFFIFEPYSQYADIWREKYFTASKGAERLKKTK